MFRTQYIPDFFVAEHYGLWNTSSWGSKDLASALHRKYNTPRSEEGSEKL
jgi:hypothetical protein